MESKHLQLMNLIKGIEQQVTECGHLLKTTISLIVDTLEPSFYLIWTPAWS